jgi:lipoprotein-releasing system permease protein
MFIFIVEGSLLGIVGALSGAGLGLLSCWLANRFQIVSLPADVYSISYVPLAPHIADVMLAIGVSFLVSIVATIYPARTAARVRPSQAMKEH